MRIVIINSGLRGIASYCFNLYKYLTKRNHQVLLISESKWYKEKIPIYEAKSIKIFGVASLVYEPDKVIEEIRKFNPDIIHHHFASGTFDFLFGKIVALKKPTVMTVHLSIDSKKQFFDISLFIHFMIFKRFLKNIDKIISISRFIKKQIQKTTDYNPKNNVVIYAGVDLKIFRPTKRKKSKTLSLIYVGQIMPEKGVDVLIDSVIEARKKIDVTLTLVGNGHLKPLLQRKTKGKEYIKWVGFVKTQKEIAAYYSKADITVLPTRWDEAFSLVPVESIACGTPVLATKKGGTPEIVVEEKTGHLIKSCIKKELTKAIISLDKKKLEKMRKNCRKTARQKYSLEKWGRKHEILYADLLKK
ncbi:MAG: glycosyltransferase family 1 protein [Nanoarchaeota archaeon]|nr:MAG: glycosyltransferase family 1 protein [Nanoarchaeota archaeon]